MKFVSTTLFLMLIAASPAFSLYGQHEKPNHEKLNRSSGYLTLMNNVVAQDVKPQPSATDVSRKVTLKCSNRKLWRGDTLTVDMSIPHGRDLAILSPNDRFFWLRSWEPNDREATAQWYAFEKVSRLRLVTSVAKGKVDNRDELIFTRTGWYSIRISYNLETDDGTPVNECKVYYTHRRRPSRGRT